MPVLDRQAARSSGMAASAGAPAAATAGVTAAAPRRQSADAAPRPAPAVIPRSPMTPPRSVPEVRPTPLHKHYLLLSAPALVLGAVAISAVELGAPLGSPIVKACVLVAAPLLAVANADAVIRIWRSAWAWMPVDRGRGLFRLAWVAAAAILYALLLLAAWLVLTA
jgi:hypothetical protein